MLFKAINTLDKEVYKVFSCGEKKLELGINKFLKEKALKEHNDRETSTYLVFNDNSANLIGFYSINIISIANYEACYCINLQFLAVDKKYQSLKHGTEILKHVIVNMIDISEKIGIRYLIVQPLEGKEQWYLERGFSEISHKQNMFLFDLRIERDGE